MVHREFAHGVNFLFTPTKLMGGILLLFILSTISWLILGDENFIKFSSKSLDKIRGMCYTLNTRRLEPRASADDAPRKKVDYLIHSAGMTSLRFTVAGNNGSQSQQISRNCPLSCTTVPKPKSTHHTLVIFFTSLYALIITQCREVVNPFSHFFLLGA